MPAKPTPHLPADFISKMKADPMMADWSSMVFSAEFQAERWKIIDHSVDKGPDQLAGIKLPVSPEVLNTAGMTFGQIHFSAIAADPLHLCEMIRLGADMDLKDSEGNTPLSLAMVSLMGYRELPGACSPLMIQRLRFVARTLIEQHANVNITSNTGMSNLHMACQAKDWELIELLLLHGAHTTIPGSKLRPPIDQLTSASDKKRFRDLVKSRKQRPPQPCPCWSNKLLVDCHATEQPYPHKFYCTCGSRKPYEKCCRKRNIFVYEKWDEESRYIRPRVVRFLDPAIKFQKYESYSLTYASCSTNLKCINTLLKSHNKTNLSTYNQLSDLRHFLLRLKISCTTRSTRPNHYLRSTYRSYAL